MSKLEKGEKDIMELRMNILNERLQELSKELRTKITEAKSDVSLMEMEAKLYMGDTCIKKAKLVAYNKTSLCYRLLTELGEAPDISSDGDLTKLYKFQFFKQEKLSYVDIEDFLWGKTKTDNLRVEKLIYSQKADLDSITRPISAKQAEAAILKAGSKQIGSGGSGTVYQGVVNGENVVSDLLSSILRFAISILTGYHPLKGH